ncbi:hypothetical protein [Burkholderia plantarii]|uniref:hypothetical protein n=1 Tax=Burkholderia plantarii TaxID=41899 RepID=UPI0018DD57A4|nr:hypothetical protein [Burkholderia plantarii]MBI0329106.1 hypothetical protein [Burkholderia plantarii]
MKIKYYVVTAHDTGFGQGDELHLIKLADGRLIGYSSEFDVCTTDIVNACTAENSRYTKWFDFDDQWKWRAATLEEIRASQLDKYLIGWKKDMKLSTEIIPL